MGSFDGVAKRREGVRERGKGGRGEDSVDGKGARVKAERAGVRGRESEESSAVDGGGREVEVEGKSDVGCQSVGRIGEGVRV